MQQYYKHFLSHRLSNDKSSKVLVHAEWPFIYVNNKLIQNRPENSWFLGFELFGQITEKSILMR